MTEQAKKRADYGQVLRIYWQFVKPYKWKIFLATFFVLVMEVLLLSDKFLFKILLDNASFLSAGTITASYFATILFYLVVVFFSVVLARLVVRWYNQRAIQKIEGSIDADFRRSFFNHIVSLSHKFHTNKKSGALISQMRKGGDAAEHLTDFFLQIISPFIFSLIIVGGALFYFDKVSAYILLALTFVLIVYGVWVQLIQRKATLIFNDADDAEKAFSGDVFTNLDSVKYFGKESLIKNKFTNYSEDSKQKLLKHRSYYLWISGGFNVLLGVGTFLILYFPIKSFIEGSVSVGTLGFIYTSYISFYSTVTNFVRNMRQFYKSTADFVSLSQILLAENEVKDSANAGNASIKKGGVEFRNIDFTYHQRKVLDGFNLEVKPGEKVALVGHSGSGKTTLVKLLYRFYDVNAGDILIDGKNIKDFKQESLRSELSIVPQECILFDDSIYNNILFSNPKASKEEVIRAMKFAQLDKFVDNLPEKENTVVGERGVKLSGGEKQRVSIARAILANKRIIVLDEATSSLDSQTEHEIQQDLQNLLKGRTSIIIAHRLSTIMNADKIVVLDKGKIVQIGTHNVLIRKPGLYKKLWNLQKGGYIGD